MASEHHATRDKAAGMLMQLRKLANHPLLHRIKYTDEMLHKMAALMLKEPSHRDADAKLIQEDMAVMSDFELHKLCRMYRSVEKFSLPPEELLMSAKFEMLDKLLPTMKEN
ncbi:PREDICTED: SWI/SNF-related matrix-associated actin-dependent regulator of chromatin subfamily A containing DEAD/H box 1B-like, partial [Priapulus caudatus]|uniref:SWI/SNF-related matrix-associated actin-dependent regulator of chromatin subfamily A containing DEAD/H box 1B-like n=1 Tax=Priapulus caudatus TaxID=37621 RepID=A0ABM1F6C4_PRICU